MYTKVERIKKDIEELARFNSTPGQGLTRFSFTEEDRKAREYIKGQMKEAGLEVYEDAAGTVVGRRAGMYNDLPVVMIGSHFDSVKNGGNFDGPAGVVAALEIARVLKERNIKTRHPMEFVAMIEEEGGRFGAGLFGSRAMVGKVTRPELYTFKDKNGITTAEAMKEFGFNPENIERAKREPGSIKAFIELHIEQGPVLEAENRDIGIVDTIVGLRHYEVEITGRPDHAGTTPMNMRADALVLSSAAVLEINRLAKEAGEGTVATVGDLKVSPGAANIVPGKVVFTIDVRSRRENIIEDIACKVEKLLEEKCKAEGFTFKMDCKISVPPVHVPGYFIENLKAKCEELGFSYRQMTSGAGHDAMIMAAMTDICLLFVPSKNGRSHCPEEWTDYDQLQKGVELILKTSLDVAEVAES